MCLDLILLNILTRVGIKNALYQRFGLTYWMHHDQFYNQLDAVEPYLLIADIFN